MHVYNWPITSTRKKPSYCIRSQVKYLSSRVIKNSKKEMKLKLKLKLKGQTWPYFRNLARWAVDSHEDRAKIYNTQGGTPANEERSRASPN